MRVEQLSSSLILDNTNQTSNVVIWLGLSFEFEKVCLLVTKKINSYNLVEKIDKQANETNIEWKK